VLPVEKGTPTLDATSNRPFPGMEGIAGAPSRGAVATASVPVAMEMLRDWGEAHVTVAEAVLTTLAAHCQLDVPHGGVRQPDEATCSQLSELHGLDGILETMALHATSAGVQFFGCILLALLCDRQEERLKAAVTLRALELVLKALQAHGGADVLSCALKAVGTFTSSPELAKRAADLGAISLVVDALKACRDRPVAQANGCQALSNLLIGDRSLLTGAVRASCTSRCEQAVGAGSIEALVAALLRHPSHEGVLHGAAAALLRLTHDDPGRVALAVEAGAKDALRKAAEHPSTREVPSALAKVELAHRYLLAQEAQQAEDAGKSSLISKAERVFKDLVFERHAAIDAELTEAMVAVGL